MKKIMAICLMGVLAMASLTGCGGAGGKKDIKTLDVVWFSDAGEGETFMSLADEYMKQHPDIKIELVEVPYSDLDNKLKNMIKIGRAHV